MLETLKFRNQIGALVEQFVDVLPPPSNSGSVSDVNKGARRASLCMLITLPMTSASMSPIIALCYATKYLGFENETSTILDCPKNKKGKKGD